jgi:hypothetical protein
LIDNVISSNTVVLHREVPTCTIAVCNHSSQSVVLLLIARRGLHYLANENKMVFVAFRTVSNEEIGVFRTDTSTATVRTGMVAYESL